MFCKFRTNILGESIIILWNLPVKIAFFNSYKGPAFIIFGTRSKLNHALQIVQISCYIEKHPKIFINDAWPANCITTAPDICTVNNNFNFILLDIPSYSLFIKKLKIFMG